MLIIVRVTRTRTWVSVWVW